MRRLWWSVKKRLLRLSTGPRRVERLGAAWELDPQDWLDARLLIGQPFEAAQRARFAERLAARRPAILYDVGANFGLYAVTSALALPGLAVEAFEPAARTRAKLALNLALNGLEGRVRVHALALSDRAGEAELSIDPRSSGLASLSPSAAERARRDFAETERVAAARLDDLIAEGRVAAPQGPIAVKIDVEGHEVEALAGMQTLLAAADGVLMVEARERNAEAAAGILGAAGWTETGRIAEERFWEKG